MWGVRRGWTGGKEEEREGAGLALGGAPSGDHHARTSCSAQRCPVAAALAAPHSRREQRTPIRAHLSGLWSSVRGTAAHSGITKPSQLSLSPPRLVLARMAPALVQGAGAPPSSALPEALAAPASVPRVSTTPSTARESPAQATDTLRGGGEGWEVGGAAARWAWKRRRDAAR